MGTSEVIRIDDTNIVSILNSWKTGLDIGKPFSKQIYLISASIAGLFYVDNIHDVLDEIKLESKLRFVREPDNQHDELAIQVKDQNDNKLGYIPRQKNPILARLMDAGKHIYGTVKEINNDDSYMNVEMEIFMDD
ncbi:MAG: HIRAN domain-containing protein [Treponema sp.]|nr:HIRAN domain-containing protein [Treponema sp.]